MGAFVSNSVINQRQSPAVYADTLANRPAFGFNGRLFVDTASPYGIYRDTGSAWVLVASSGGSSTPTLQNVTTAGNVTTLSMTALSVTTTSDSTFNSVRVGRGAGNDASNTVVGNGAFITANTASNVVAVGTDALRSLASGLGLTAVGSQALRNNTSGSRNAAFGYNVMQTNLTGGNNTAVGCEAMYSNISGGSNTAVGDSALRANTTGAQNTGIGQGALSSNIGGQYNTAVGYDAFRSNLAGTENTALGHSALYSAAGSFNVAVGCDAGRYIAGLSANNLSNSSIYIGYRTQALANNGSNEIVIGFNLIGNGTNTVTIGGSTTTANYFNGSIFQTAVTSAMIKTNSSGQFIAAVAGTDYVAPSALTGYLPLTGGTLTGLLNGTSTIMSGSVTAGGITAGSSGMNTQTFLRLQNATLLLRDLANTVTYGGFCASGLFEGNSSTETGIFSETGLGIKFYTNGSATAVGTISSSGNFSFRSTTGETVNVLGNSGEWAQRITGNSTASNSFGLLIAAGTNTSDIALNIFNQDLSSGLVRVRGTGFTEFLAAIPSTSTITGTIVSAGGIGAAGSVFCVGFNSTVSTAFSSNTPVYDNFNSQTFTGTGFTNNVESAYNAVQASLGVQMTGTNILDARTQMSAASARVFCNGGGSINKLAALTADMLFAGSMNVTTAYAIYAGAPYQQTGESAYSGTVTNYAGVYIQDITGLTNIGSQITNKYGIYQAGGSDKNFLNGELILGVGNAVTASGDNNTERKLKITADGETIYLFASTSPG